MSNEKSKNYWKGVNDKSKGKSNPPSKGTSKSEGATLGGLIGAVLGGGPGLVLGAIGGALAGDNKKQLKQKKANNGAYKAGNKKKK
jgi:uncharacterized protein YcfJ